MWRLWNTDSQEEQGWDINNEASDGIPVLASDSDESVIFVAERPLPSVQYSSQSCHPGPAYLLKFS